MANLLVVDDELVMCELLKDLLKEKGYKVNYTLSGRDGLKAITENKNYDVVLVDIKMPEMTGIQVLEKVKEIDPNLVVIVITGFPSFESIRSAMKFGAFDYITKPFDIDEISFVVGKAIAFRNITVTNRRLVVDLEEHSKRLEEKVEGRTKELAFIYKVAQEISSHLGVEQVLKTIVHKVRNVLKSEICSILLLDKESGELSIKCACGLEQESIETTRIKVGEEISGWVLQNKEGILVEDIEKDPRFARRNKEKYYTHSFISMPLIVKDEAMGVININNKSSREVFTEEDLRFVKGLTLEAAIAIENAGLYSSLESAYMRTVMALTSAIDAKDHYTKDHSENVTRYGVAMAREMGLSEDKISDLEKACQLHDLGKIGIHDHILTKPGKLTDEEWEEIKMHTIKGAMILKPLIFLSGVIKLVEQHHERYDGKGYPYGLKGENILLGARIMAVADSFDAMITERPYRKAFSKEEAVEELKRNKGKQFDPEIVDLFLRVLDKNPDIIVKK